MKNFVECAIQAIDNYVQKNNFVGGKKTKSSSSVGYLYHVGKYSIEIILDTFSKHDHIAFIAYSGIIVPEEYRNDVKVLCDSLNNSHCNPVGYFAIDDKIGTLFYQIQSFIGEEGVLESTIKDFEVYALWSFQLYMGVLKQVAYGNPSNKLVKEHPVLSREWSSIFVSNNEKKDSVYSNNLKAISLALTKHGFNSLIESEKAHWFQHIWVADSICTFDEVSTNRYTIILRSDSRTGYLRIYIAPGPSGLHIDRKYQNISSSVAIDNTYKKKFGTFTTQSPIGDICVFADISLVNGPIDTSMVNFVITRLVCQMQEKLGSYLTIAVGKQPDFRIAYSSSFDDSSASNFNEHADSSTCANSGSQSNGEIIESELTALALSLFDESEKLN